MTSLFPRVTLLALALPALAAAQGPITASVFEDRNANGVRDPGERPLAAIAVSNQADVVATDAAGEARLERGSTGVVYVSVPDGYRSVGPFWRASAAPSMVFPLAPVPAPRSFSFVHASDTHVEQRVVERMRRFRAMTDSIKPAFAIITGDLIRDAMSQTEPVSRGYFDLFVAEAKEFRTPLRLVPGNHDHFGVIRSRSKVSESDPMYDRAMYRGYFGPDYYSFTYGGIHFIGLNTLSIDDSAYYGIVDSVQLAWIQRDLKLVPPSVPIVTFNHIPMVSAWEILTGFVEMPLVSSIRRVNGKTTHRHTVANTLDVITAMRGHAWVLALGGHIHAREKVMFQTGGVLTRFEQSAAIVGGGAIQDVVIPSGFTVYTVRAGIIDSGRFVRLDPPPGK
jgi:hypothetical protein